MVPNGWHMRELQELAIVERGRFSPRPRNDPQYYGGSMPFVQTGDIANAKTYLTQYKQTLNEKGILVSKVFPANSILITIAANIGETAITTFDVACPDSLVGIKPIFAKSDVFWLKMVLETKQRDLDTKSTQNAQKNINLETLKPLLLLTPPLAEQKKIAQILYTWDNAIATTEKLLENSQRQKQALMQQLLTGKKRFPGFNEKWTTKSLGQIGEIKSAGVDKNIIEGEKPVRLLNFTDVFNRSFIYSNELNHLVTASDAKILSCDVKKGDVFFTPSSETRNDAGIPAVAAEDIDDCCYSYHVVRFRLKEEWDLNFKAYIFTTPEFRKQACMLADGSGQRYVISQDGFRSIKITYPSYQEQVLIGKAIKAAEDEVNLLKQKISYFKEEKKALMQQLLTGKRRVKVDY